MTPQDHAALEDQIAQWRSYLRRRQAIHAVDIAELEDHLRAQVEGLVGTGLAQDEAFFVAVKRLGALDALSREFALEHSERLWKQLVVLAPEGPEPVVRQRAEAFVAFGLAVLAGVLIKLPALFGLDFEKDTFFARNLSFFVLPLLTGFFAWKRQLPAATLRGIVAAFLAAGVIANAYPFVAGGSTEPLLALHLPIALWLAVGIAYAGGRWHQSAGRMDFIRFSGELVIYFVLIALGGGVLLALSANIFGAIGIDIEPFMEQWLPSCAMGAVMVAAWLVEAKQSVVENMAPVLTRLFTPLFAIALLTFLGALAWTGRGIAIERDVLIAFDLVLVVVLALLLYTLSARDPEAPPGPFDVLQLVLVLAALLANLVALAAMVARIGGMGFTPNRVVALGLNLVLLANLTGAVLLSLRFLRGQGTFASLERWQTAYLPVYALWAAFVAVVLPVLFRFS